MKRLSIRAAAGGLMFAAVVAAASPATCGTGNSERALRSEEQGERALNRRNARRDDESHGRARRCWHVESGGTDRLLLTAAVSFYGHVSSAYLHLDEHDGTIADVHPITVRGQLLRRTPLLALPRVSPRRSYKRWGGSHDSASTPSAIFGTRRSRPRRVPPR